MTWDGLTPPYATIVADPPWPYDTAREGRAALQHNPAWRGVHEVGFTVMEMTDLLALPVHDLAARNAHLYLWTTNAFMVEAHQLARAWGFEPKTILTWVKVHHGDSDRPSMKTGHWFRGATEHVVFAVRGSLGPQTRRAIPTAFFATRLFQHSAKPAVLGDIVEEMSPGPYVELFCRQPRLGWDHWGHGYELAGQQGSTG